MIRRAIEPLLLRRASRHPVIVVTGPRQSGKTTLCRSAFPQLPYVSLEPHDEREFARHDPRGFLARFADGAVIDEVQRVPELLSMLQALVDEQPRAGRFILTGSQNLALLESVSQSLAGRASLLTLLPFSLEELAGAGLARESLFETLLAGGYPRIHDQALPPAEWIADYVATYVERDVRQLLAIGDLAAFQTFVRLAAGRSGQLVNFSALGADAGVSHVTARSWLSVLEAGYVLARLAPWHSSATSRLVKATKLHFVDSGLLCWLLGIRSAEQLVVHPLRGAVFESFVVSEIRKARLNRGLPDELWFVRDRKGREIDVALRDGAALLAIEAKSGETATPETLHEMAGIAELLRSDPSETIARAVVYGGAASQLRSDGAIRSWRELATPAWHLPREAS